MKKLTHLFYSPSHGLAASSDQVNWYVIPPPMGTEWFVTNLTIFDMPELKKELAVKDEEGTFCKS